MEHQDYQELLIPHSLDALEVSEARELEAHLETCAECRAELVALRDEQRSWLMRRNLPHPVRKFVPEFSRAYALNRRSIALSPE